MPASTASTASALLDAKPIVIAALHLPDFRAERCSPVELEDYLLANLAVFADGGISAVMIQDQTREPGSAAVETVALMGALVRIARRAFPQLVLGVIVQAHDAEAPLAIAHAAGASFVRLKVFAGTAITAEGSREGLGATARAARLRLGRPDIAILADVHDRTCMPSGDVSLDRAALWAEGLGADALILTGADFAGSCARVTQVRAAGARRPILIGGGIDETNIAEALAVAQGVIVSTSLMKTGGRGLALRWDKGRTRRLMDLAYSQGE
jgi:predicted TIM-barrel enzyme